MQFQINKFIRLKIVALSLPIWLLSFSNIQASESADQWSIKQLVQGWANIEQVEATYKSEQSSIFFDEPVISNGTLEYEAPDKLHRQILNPINESLRIDGNQLYIKKVEYNEKKGEHINEQQYTISSHEELNHAISALKAFLAGDLSKMDEYFLANMTGDENEWTLSLSPANEKISEKYSAISMQGKELKINQIIFVNNEDEETKINITYSRFE